VRRPYRRRRRYKRASTSCLARGWPMTRRRCGSPARLGVTRERSDHKSPAIRWVLRHHGQRRSCALLRDLVHAYSGRAIHRRRATTSRINLGSPEAPGAALDRATAGICSPRCSAGRPPATTASKGESMVVPTLQGLSASTPGRSASGYGAPRGESPASIIQIPGRGIPAARSPSRHRSNTPADHRAAPSHPQTSRSVCHER